MGVEDESIAPSAIQYRPCLLPPPTLMSTSGSIGSVGTMLRRRRSCKKKQLRLKLLVRDAEGIIREASVL
jgi:hypothetical protein